MFSRTPRVAFAGLALALTMAACASSDPDDASGTDPVTTEASTTDTAADDTTAATAPGGTEPGSGADSTTPPTETEESASGAGTTAPPEPVAVPAALQFTAPLVGGGEFDGAAVAGTPTVFWFWAPT